MEPLRAIVIKMRNPQRRLVVFPVMYIMLVEQTLVNHSADLITLYVHRNFLCPSLVRIFLGVDIVDYYSLSL